MMLTDPAAIATAFTAASASQKLGFVLFYGGAAMVILSCCMQVAKARTRKN